MVELQLSGVFRAMGDRVTGTAILLQLGEVCIGAVRILSREEWDQSDPLVARHLGDQYELRLRLEPPFSGPIRRLKGEFIKRDPVSESLTGSWAAMSAEISLAHSLLTLDLGGLRLHLIEAIPMDKVAHHPMWSDFFLRQLSTVNPWQLVVNHDRLQGPLERLLAVSDFSTNVFVMMRFRQTRENRAIRETIRAALTRHDLYARFADELALADDLWENVSAYMCGSRFGVAVVEEIEERSFNPNVAIEIGFMQALRRQVLVLKDKRVPSLPTDLAGRLYREFDSYNVEDTVAAAIEGWTHELEALQLLPSPRVVYATLSY